MFEPRALGILGKSITSAVKEHQEVEDLRKSICAGSPSAASLKSTDECPSGGERTHQPGVALGARKRSLE